jgi:molybdate transport system substrate-binding protein
MRRAMAANTLAAMAFACSFGCYCAGAIAAQVPIVAAASDLQFPLQAIADEFTRQTGNSVKLVFGSSGNFHSQIAQGAPFELFMSADESFVAALAKDGRTRDDGVLYAIGRIVLFAPHGSPLKPDPELKDLAAAITDGRVRKFAIANPEHAPYGRAAQQALTRDGLWDRVRPTLVIGENVAQAAQFAASGSAQGGIFAYSLALSPAVSKLGTFTLLPMELHEPLRQRMVLLKDAGDNAKAFYRFLQTPRARAVFQQYGFVLPDE